VHEFNAIRYYASTGGLGNAYSTARLNYYGIGGYPTVWFCGSTVTAVGAGSETATGLPYRAIIESLLDDPSHFKITVNSFDLTPPTGSIDLDVEIMEDLPVPTGYVLRTSVTEDNVTYGTGTHEDVNRSMGNDVPITVSSLGEIQNAIVPFEVDPAWVSDAMKVVAFIQYDGAADDDPQPKAVLQSAVTRPTPDHALRYYALGERATVAPSGNFSFDFFHFYNMGNVTDHYTISVELDGPDDWSAVLCEEGLCHGPTYEQDLVPGESMGLFVEGEAPSSGYGRMTVTMSQDGAPGMERTLTYIYMTDDLEILLVDDDGAESFEDYFTDVLDHHGYSYGIWDRNSGAVSSDVLSYFPVVVWNLGWAFPTLDEDDRDALGTYLDAGGKLFITGQDLGWEMQDIGGAAYQWYQDYLHTLFINDDTNNYTLSGVDGDHISHGLDLVIQGGDGANNQDFPSDIDPADGSATAIWTYDVNRNGAIRADTGIYRVVYLAFGFEAINNADDRRACLHRSISWLRTGASDAEESAPIFRAYFGSSPNPAGAGLTLRFTLPSAGQTRLDLFGPDGRLAHTLADGWRKAGNHTIAWDRSDGGGARVPAGVYYGRLISGELDLMHKVVLFK